MNETAVERRLRQLHDHIVKGLQRQPDDRVTTYCSPPDVAAIDAGREAIALWRVFLGPMHSSETGASREIVKSYAAALLARCEGEK